MIFSLVYLEGTDEKAVPIHSYAYGTVVVDVEVLEVLEDVLDVELDVLEVETEVLEVEVVIVVVDVELEVEDVEVVVEYSGWS